LKLTLTTLLCILFLQCFAQQNFQPGSIQKVSGETVQGWIDYRAWLRNPKSIRFKENEDGVATTLTVFDLSSFAITGKDSYKKAIVSKDMRPVEEANITVNTQDTTAIDTVFLRVITEGQKLGLYELMDDKTHYYIKDSTGQFMELFYKVYIVKTLDNNPVHIRPIFRDQLRAYVQNEVNGAKVQKMLRNITYKDYDLESVVNTINGVAASPSMVQKRSKVVFFVSGGISYSTLETTGFHRLEGMKYNSSLSPTIGFGGDIVSKRQLGAIAIRFEALYSSMSFKGNSTLENSMGDQLEREYSLKMTNITPALSFLYSPFRGPAYRVYGGIGAAYNFTFYNRNELKEVNISENSTEEIEDLLDYEKTWLSVPACIGGIVNKFEFIFSAKILGNFERFVSINTKLNNYSLRAAYRF
jgi:hypothetical protein